MITIEIENVYSKITGTLPLNIITEIDNKLSYYVNGYQYMKAFKSGFYDSKTKSWQHWDGKKHLLNNSLKFQTGLLPYVEEVLKECEVQYSVVDKRVEPSAGKPIKVNTKHFKPRQYQIDIVNAAIQNKSGMIKAATGCHRRGQGILMYDGTVKSVEDVAIGDLLMGPDSKPRKVLRLCRGVDEMVEIKPTKGKSFVVNKEHVLTLVRTKKSNSCNNINDNKISDITVNEYLKLSKTQKHLRKLFRVPVSFNKETTLPIEPYFLGLLLGDGTLGSSIGITTADKEIENEINAQAKKWNLNIRKQTKKDNKASSFYFVKQKHIKNPISKQLENLQLRWKTSDNKFIPFQYKTASFEDRLQLLAGILDTDGSLGHGFDFISKSKQLSNDVCYVARSLGMAAYLSECQKYDQHGNGGTYYRVSISGNVSVIPVRIQHKKAQERRQKKNVLRTGFKVVDLKCKEEYFGFTLDRDGRYLLDDFTVTHNSGKSLVIAMLAGQLNVKTVVYVIGIDLLYQMQRTIEKALGIKCGIIGDGHCDIKKITVATVWTVANAFDKKYNPFDDEEKAVRNEKLSNTEKSKIVKMVNESQMFIFDEAQFLGAESLQLIAQASSNARYRFGLSGTPWRDGGDDILLEAATGKQFVDINATTLINTVDPSTGYTVLVPPKIYFFQVPESEKKIDKNYLSIYNQYIVDNEVRNGMVIDSMSQLHGNGRKVLILVKMKRHGLNLLKKIPPNIRAYYLDGDAPSDEREAVKELFNTGNLDVIIASSIFDQGIDLPLLDALILAGGGKSATRTLQRIGRVIRSAPGTAKKDAIVVDFIDQEKYVFNHSKNRYKIYKTEPGFIVKLPKELNKL